MRDILHTACAYDKTERHNIPDDEELQKRAALGGPQYLTDYDFRDMVTQYVLFSSRETEGDQSMEYLQQSVWVSQREFRC